MLFDTVTTATSINGEVVWYKNKFKNLLLKIKHLFIKPKYLKHFNLYKDKKVNSEYYGVIKLENEKRN